MVEAQGRSVEARAGDGGASRRAPPSPGPTGLPGSPPGRRRGPPVAGRAPGRGPAAARPGGHRATVGRRVGTAGRRTAVERLRRGRGDPAVPGRRSRRCGVGRTGPPLWQPTLMTGTPALATGRAYSSPAIGTLGRLLGPDRGLRLRHPPPPPDRCVRHLPPPARAALRALRRAPGRGGVQLQHLPGRLAQPGVTGQFGSGSRSSSSASRPRSGAATCAGRCWAGWHSRPRSRPATSCGRSTPGSSCSCTRSRWRAWPPGANGGCGPPCGRCSPAGWWARWGSASPRRSAPSAPSSSPAPRGSRTLFAGFFMPAAEIARLVVPQLWGDQRWGQPYSGSTPSSRPPATSASSPCCWSLRAPGRGAAAGRRCWALSACSSSWPRSGRCCW